MLGSESLHNSPVNVLELEVKTEEFSFDKRIYSFWLYISCLEQDWDNVPWWFDLLWSWVLPIKTSCSQQESYWWKITHLRFSQQLAHCRRDSWFFQKIVRYFLMMKSHPLQVRFFPTEFCSQFAILLCLLLSFMAQCNNDD